MVVVAVPRDGRASVDPIAHHETRGTIATNCDSRPRLAEMMLDATRRSMCSHANSRRCYDDDDRYYYSAVAVVLADHSLA